MGADETLGADDTDVQPTIGEALAGFSDSIGEVYENIAESWFGPDKLREMREASAKQDALRTLTEQRRAVQDARTERRRELRDVASTVQEVALAFTLTMLALLGTFVAVLFAWRFYTW